MEAASGLTTSTHNVVVVEAWGRRSGAIGQAAKSAGERARRAEMVGRGRVLRTVVRDGQQVGNDAVSGPVETC